MRTMYMENQHLVQTIKQWLDLEDKISQMSKELRDMRKKKKELNMSLMGVMKENEIDCFDITDGKLMYTKNKVKQALSKKHLLAALGQYFQNDNNKAKEVAGFILESRQVKIKENIKHKIKKK